MKALTVGSAMVDTIAIIDSERIERMTMRNAERSFLLLEEGLKTEAGEISTHCGGGAINAAISLSRLGLDVSTLARLGRDGRAETVLTRLSEEGVSTRWTMRDAAAPTGSSVMLASHERNAAIFTFRGANTLLRAEDLNDDAFAVDLVYVTSLSDRSADCFPEIVSRARRQGAMVATNPGIRQLSVRREAFFEALAEVDLLAINQVEAEALVPGLIARSGEPPAPPHLEGDGERPSLLTSGLRGGGYDIELAAFTAALCRLGPRWVIVTDGGDGAYLGTAEDLTFCPALELPVAGTAGAGDAFSSTVSAWLAAGHDGQEALRAGTCNAASVLGHVDTQSGLLDRDRLVRRMADTEASLPCRHWALQPSN